MSPRSELPLKLVLHSHLTCFGNMQMLMFIVATAFRSYLVVSLYRKLYSAIWMMRSVFWSSGLCYCSAFRFYLAGVQQQKLFVEVDTQGLLLDTLWMLQLG
ncbi:hypothetical protein MLD38_010845 [Melastoma candidum]|uniref:Uncharacterized protein n=1 Tax=Melastoma candidum TaxID=119954 RepID=A0ACB9R2Z5_9MYRT|nr:hypothetical protein MLD38_010845 [Melastoma candidum]